MRYLPYTTTNSSPDFDPKSISIHGSNDSKSWMELFKSEETDTLPYERRSTAKFILANNDDEDFKFYTITFKMKDGALKMHLGHLGVVPVLTKTCTADTFYDITEHVVLPAPYEFNSNDELKNAVKLWMTDESAAMSTYGHISQWKVAKITSMTALFRAASLFDQDLSAWDVANVSDMSYMFDSASAFNKDLSAWNVANVEYMESMFYDAVAFNQTLCWDISKVEYTNDMFEGTKGGKLKSKGGTNTGFPEC